MKKFNYTEYLTEGWMFQEAGAKDAYSNRQERTKRSEQEPELTPEFWKKVCLRNNYTPLEEPRPDEEYDNLSLKGKARGDSGRVGLFVVCSGNRPGYKKGWIFYTLAQSPGIGKTWTVRDSGSLEGYNTAGLHEKQDSTEGRMFKERSNSSATTIEFEPCVDGDPVTIEVNPNSVVSWVVASAEYDEFGLEFYETSAEEAAIELPQAVEGGMGEDSIALVWVDDKRVFASEDVEYLTSTDDENIQDPEKASELLQNPRMEDKEWWKQFCEAVGSRFSY